MFSHAFVYANLLFFMLARLLLMLQGPGWAGGTPFWPECESDFAMLHVFILCSKGQVGRGELGYLTRRVYAVCWPFCEHDFFMLPLSAMARGMGTLLGGAGLVSCLCEPTFIHPGRPSQQEPVRGSKNDLFHIHLLLWARQLRDRFPVPHLCGFKMSCHVAVA